MKNIILLTGSTGFLGYHLLKLLLEQKYNVIVVKRTTSNIKRIENLLCDPLVLKVINWDKKEERETLLSYKVNTIVHVATNYGHENVGHSSIIASNYLFPVEVLEICMKNGLKNFINTDTFYTKLDTNYDTLRGYILTKKHFLDWIKEYSKFIKVINCRIEHVYGPYDHSKKFIPSIILKLLTNVGEIEFTMGEQKRDFIFVDDVVRAYSAILHNLSILDPYTEIEIGTGKSERLSEVVYSIRNIVEHLETPKLRTKLRFGTLRYKSGEIMDSKADIRILSMICCKS